MYYEMIYGQYPYEGQNAVSLYNDIVNKNLEFPSEIMVSEESIDFIQKCLQFDEKKRLSWEEVFRHKLISLEIDE